MGTAGQTRLLIEDALLDYRAALLDDSGRLIAFDSLHRTDTAPRPGDILLGRIGKIARHLDAAFVDIGSGRDGFLPLGGGKPPGEGARLIVQVQGAERPGKGARLSSAVTLKGRSMLLQPARETHGLSKKIKGGERLRLEALLARLPEKPPVLLRSSAAGCTDEELETEYHRLAARWQDLQQQAGRQKAPGMLENIAAPERLLDSFSAREPAEILTDGGALAARLRQWCRRHAPHLSGRIRAHQGPQPLFDAWDVDHQLDEALSPVIDLPSGGTVTIEATQALTAIDIDSGSSGSGRRQRETLLQTLREAMTEIARQIVLREIGGIIVIDCPHLQAQADRGAVIRWLKDAFASDAAPHRILPMNDFDLIAMTRRHGGTPLHERYLAPAAPEPSARLTAIRLLRAACAGARRHGGSLLRITCPPAVAACLEDGILDSLRERTGYAIEIRPDAGCAPGHYDLSFTNGPQKE